MPTKHGIPKILNMSIDVPLNISWESLQDLWICAWSSPCALSHKVSPLTPNLENSSGHSKMQLSLQGKTIVMHPKIYPKTIPKNYSDYLTLYIHIYIYIYSKNDFRALKYISVSSPALKKGPGHSRRRFFLKKQLQHVRAEKFAGGACETKAPTASTEQKLLERASKLLDSNNYSIFKNNPLQFPPSV